VPMAIVDAPRSRPRAIESGGIEAIPTDRRHGSPWQLFATWSSPNLEFATVFVGVLGIIFGLSFWQAVLALALGTALGALTQGILSTWGPREGLAQFVLSRTAFGFFGNILPAGINTVMAGLGWFAVNSVSGAFALSTLTGMPTVLSLLIIVIIEVGVAFIGHDLVQTFERYAAYILGAIFLIATVTIFTHAHLGFVPKGGGFSFAGFTATAAAAFGYACGWNPYASDYSRYLPASTRRATIAWAAGLGNFVSCVVLMVAGAASATIAMSDSDPTGAFVSSMPPAIKDLTLVAIAVGAIAANALNIYSGAMSFLAAGIRIPFALRRAIVALGFGVIGFFIAWSALADAGQKYNNFLLVIAYWIAPWLGVVLTDRFLRRGTSIAELLPDHRRYVNPAGIIAFVIAAFVSIWLFCDETFYVGPVSKNTGVGDITAVVGFVLAALIYWVLFRVFTPTLGAPIEAHASSGGVPIGIDAADDVA
jgi:NCS1 family nucleobase:cation symporter-1